MQLVDCFFLKVLTYTEGKIYPTKLAGRLANLILGPDMQREVTRPASQSLVCAESTT